MFSDYFLVCLYVHVYITWMFLLVLFPPSPPPSLAQPDRGLTSSPDPRAVTPPPPPSGQQQSQWHHQHNVHHLPPYQHRITFGHIFTPLQRSNPPRAMSAGNIACTNSAAPSRTNPSPSQQELLMSLHQRQKSESPLPDMPVDAELPTFVPQNPVLPQRRLLSQATRPEISVTTTTTSGRGPSHVAQESSLGSAVIGRLTRPSNADHSNTKAKSAPVSPDQMRKTVAKSLAAIPSGWEGGRGEGGQRNPGEIQVAISPPTSPSSLGRDWGSHISNHGSDLRRSPLTFSEGDSERSEECSKGKVERDVIPSPSLSTNQLTTNTSRSRSKIPSPAPVSMATGRESTQSPQPARKVQGAAPPLRPTELATLSLLVVDTLPQLIVFLGMDYSEYEKITSEETSPQRQSLKVSLMPPSIPPCWVSYSFLSLTFSLPLRPPPPLSLSLSLPLSFSPSLFLLLSLFFPPSHPSSLSLLTFSPGFDEVVQFRQRM